MTDKEKRELKDGVISIFNRFNILDHAATIGELRDDILRCINSMQEEPKFKVGDNIKPIDSCLGSQRTIIEVCDSWYVTNQGPLDFEYEANWELVEELAISVWHDAKETPPDDIIVFRYIDGLTTCRYVGQTMKDVVAWAYFKDLKKL